MSGNKSTEAAKESPESGRVEFRTSTLASGVLTLLFLIPLLVILAHHFLANDPSLPAGSTHVQVTANAPSGLPGNKCSINESWPYDGHGYVELVKLSGACPATSSVTGAYATPTGTRLELSGGHLVEPPVNYQVMAIVYGILAAIGFVVTVYLRRGDRKAAVLVSAAAGVPAGAGPTRLQGAY